MREVCGALRKLTGQKLGEEQVFHVFLVGLPSQQRMRRELFRRTAERWADWWEENRSPQVSDPAYAHVNLPLVNAQVEIRPPLPGTHFKTGEHSSGHVLKSVLDPAAKYSVFYDLDTGRIASLPEKWRTAGDIPARMDEIIDWAAQEGFDMAGTEYVDSENGRRVYAIRPIGLKAWELGDNRWKAKFSDITVEALQAEGAPVDDWLLHHDRQTNAIYPQGTASFVYITREGTPGLLFVGVEVQDDSLQPGGVFDGDIELSPIAFRKGRRFGVTLFEEVPPPRQ